MAVTQSAKMSDMLSNAVGRHKGRWGPRSPTREDSHDELSTSAAHKGSPSADSRVSRDPQPSATSHQVRPPVPGRCRTACVVRAPTAVRCHSLGTAWLPACACCIAVCQAGEATSSWLWVMRGLSCSQCSPLHCRPSDLRLCRLGMCASACRLTWSLPILRKHLGMAPGLGRYA